MVTLIIFFKLAVHELTDIQKICLSANWLFCQ